MAIGGEKIAEEDMEEVYKTNLLDQQDEIMALESIYTEANQFFVLCRPQLEDDSQYVLQIRIKIDINQDGIEVEAWIPYGECEEPRVDNNGPLKVRPQFERTISGKRWRSCFHVDYVPPLTMHIIMPKDYPSSCAPELKLSCIWMGTQQLDTLAQQLQQLWIDNIGLPVVYTWVDWLQSNVLSHLGIDKTLILTSTEDVGYLEAVGIEDVTEASIIKNSLIEMVRYDYQQDCLNFMQNKHDCNICFDEKFGREFFRISECFHHFCRDCLTEYCAMHVSDGTVQHLMCPDHDCKVPLPPAVIQDCLGEDAYKKWEGLLLQKALDTMGDIEYCPRCHMPVIKDPDEKLNLANCVYCNFSFCTKCSEAWHSSNRCENLDEQLRALEESASGGNAPLSKEDKLRKLRLKKYEILSKSVIYKTTKPCPSCKMSIEKFDGCNLVKCSLCRQEMCWVCGKDLKDGYDHFQKQCYLFPGPDFRGYINRPEAVGAGMVRMALRDDENARQMIKACPRCRQRNLKEGRNNHIRCWSCKTNFCFLCGEKLGGNVTIHFRAPSTCVQHS